MNYGLWIGFISSALLVAWGIGASRAGSFLLNQHGLLIVVGGTLAAALVSCPLRGIYSAMIRLLGLFGPSRLPTPEAAITAMVAIARQAQTGGGLLSLRDTGREIAGGFVNRAISVAIATAETAQTQKTIGADIRQLRIQRMEDANVFRTLGVLSPMFGILGTLLGMIEVLSNLQDPTKVGPAMAVALSSAFLGIFISNFICTPVANRLRAAAMQETLVLSVLLEGVLDIAANKDPYLVELDLAAFSETKRRELAAADAGGTPPAGTAP